MFAIFFVDYCSKKLPLEMRKFQSKIEQKRKKKSENVVNDKNKHSETETQKFPFLKALICNAICNGINMKSL